MSTVAQSPEFQKAAEDSRKLKAKPAVEELLQLYAYYKQGTQDPPIDKAPAPSMWDVKGKTKQKAWQKIVDEGVTPEEAQKQYVELVEGLKEKYGYDENKVPESVGSS